MEPIRAPFIVGLIGCGIGIVLLLAWWFIAVPQAVMLRFLHGLFFGLGMLLSVTGGFLALCCGMVYVLKFFTQPRAAAAAKPAK
jgi:hypothetical protein